MNPTARSLGRLRQLGYEAAVVERFLHHAGPHGIRQDLFGLADIEAICDDHTLYVQATPADRLADHVAKCFTTRMPRLKGDARPERFALDALVACRDREFEIWSWGKRANGRWHLRRLRAVRQGGELAFVEAAPPPESAETPLDRAAPS